MGQRPVRAGQVPEAIRGRAAAGCGAVPRARIGPGYGAGGSVVAYAVDHWLRHALPDGSSGPVPAELQHQANLLAGQVRSGLLGRIPAQCVGRVRVGGRTGRR